jgi:hypothetical protein
MCQQSDDGSETGDDVPAGAVTPRLRSGQRTWGTRSPGRRPSVSGRSRPCAPPFGRSRAAATATRSRCGRSRRRSRRGARGGGDGKRRRERCPDPGRGAGDVLEVEGVEDAYRVRRDVPAAGSPTDSSCMSSVSTSTSWRSSSQCSRWCNDDVSLVRPHDIRPGAGTNCERCSSQLAARLRLG